MYCYIYWYIHFIFIIEDVFRCINIEGSNKASAAYFNGDLGVFLDLYSKFGPIFI